MLNFRTLLTASTLCLLSPQAHAVTAGDFLDRMSEQERSGFINGAFDMLSYELGRAGQGDKAACIIEWYFGGSGPQELAATFSSHRDLPATAIIRTLADRHCE